MNVGKLLDAFTGGTSTSKNVGGQKYTEHRSPGGERAFSEQKNLGGYSYTETTFSSGQKVRSEEKDLFGQKYTDHRW